MISAIYWVLLTKRILIHKMCPLWAAVVVSELFKHFLSRVLVINRNCQRLWYTLTNWVNCCTRLFACNNFVCVAVIAVWLWSAKACNCSWATWSSSATVFWSCPFFFWRSLASFVYDNQKKSIILLTAHRDGAVNTVEKEKLPVLPFSRFRRTIWWLSLRFHTFLLWLLLVLF